MPDIDYISITLVSLVGVYVCVYSSLFTSLPNVLADKSITDNRAKYRTTIHLDIGYMYIPMLYNS